MSAREGTEHKTIKATNFNRAKGQKVVNQNKTFSSHMATLKDIATNNFSKTIATASAKT